MRIEDMAGEMSKDKILRSFGDSTVIFHQIACLLNQIAKIYESNQYRIIKYLNQIL